jgi:UDP-N-acetylglucosamine 4,6-dehydratase/UDP-glucose 4-epimerase
MISTDKTAIVSGVYGASKFLMERLTHQFEANYPKHTYRVVRYGNVLYSTGSVLCKWKDLLEQNKEIIITNPDATRFYWTVEQAVDLIFDCLENAIDSQPYVPEMKSMRMGDLLTAMSNKYLPSDGTLKVKEIGMQPGENLHEKVLADGIPSNEAEKFTIEEIQDMI